MFDRTANEALATTVARISVLGAAALLTVFLAASPVSASQLRDPMVPLSQPEVTVKPKPLPALKAPPPALVLSAIQFKRATGLGTAIINGEWVSPGSTVEGATVIHIEDDSVTLDRAGQRVTLRLISDNHIKKRPSPATRPES